MDNSAPEFEPRIDTKASIDHFAIKLPEYPDEDERYLKHESDLFLDALALMKKYAELNAENPLDPNNLNKTVYDADGVEHTHLQFASVNARHLIALGKKTAALGKPSNEVTGRDIYLLQETLYASSKHLDEAYPMDRQPKENFVTLPIEHPKQFLELKKHFAYITHEFNQPMSALGFMEALERHLKRDADPDPERVASSCRRINVAFEQINKFITQTAEPLLKNALTKENLPISDMVDAVKSGLEEGVVDANRPIQIDLVSPDDATIRILGNAEKVKQLVKNIAKNSTDQYNAKEKTDPIKFATDPRIISARFEEPSENAKRLYKLPDNQEYVLLIIEDRATGFVEMSDGYFIPTDGYRIGKTHKLDPEKKGTGYGMQYNVNQVALDGIFVFPENVEYEEDIESPDGDGSITDKVKSTHGAMHLIFIPKANIQDKAEDTSKEPNQA